ncbi:MAG TPA: hypothetical protein VGZ90_17620 [Puia sp.]|jgi:hypothetical protein|nr:hypothetical protein [Puia sp.]
MALESGGGSGGGKRITEKYEKLFFLTETAVRKTRTISGGLNSVPSPRPVTLNAGGSPLYLPRRRL